MPRKPGGSSICTPRLAGQVHRVVPGEAQAHPFVGHAEVGEAVGEKTPGGLDELGVQTADDDAPQRSGLSAAQSGAVGLHDEAAHRVEAQGETVAPEPVDRDGDLDVLEEPGQEVRLVGIVPS